MKKSFIVVFTLFINALAFAQSNDDFTYAATDTSNIDFYFLIEKVTDSYKEVWIKAISPEKTIKNKKGKYIKTGGGHKLSFMNIYCDDRKFDALETVSYDKNGKVTGSNYEPNYDNRVIPGSVMSAIFESICGN